MSATTVTTVSENSGNEYVASGVLLSTAGFQLGEVSSRIIADTETFH